MDFEGLHGLDQGSVALILDDAATSTRGEIQEWSVNEPLNVAGNPGRMLQTGKGRKIFDDAGANSGERDPSDVRGFGDIQFGIRVPEAGADRRQLVQQPPFNLPRLYLVLLAREFVDHRAARVGVADPVTKLRGQIPLNFFSAQSPDSP